MKGFLVRAPEMNTLNVVVTVGWAAYGQWQERKAQRIIYLRRKEHLHLHLRPSVCVVRSC